MGLTDVLQVNARNRFSGCVRIQNGENSGIVFFRDGDIVHAEQGGRSGEEAVVDILQWQQGRFSVEQNVVTARRTISKSCEHLLLDAHRKLDERQAGRGEPAPPVSVAEAKKQPASATDTVRAIPGVAEVVLVTREGQRHGDEGYASEQVAGQTVYLAMLCAEFGGLFQAGEIRSATVEGADRHMLLYASKSQYLLGVFVWPDADIGAMDAAIRSALSKGR